MSVFRRKPIDQSIKDTEAPEHQLRKVLSALDLTVFGVGVIVGTGIFVLTGVAAASKAGPAIAVSFVVCGIACALAALCYAEFASTVPVAGSAYTFSYASLGELIAWIIGWDLVLELALGASTVSVGWSKYFTTLLGKLGITLPDAIAGETAKVNLPAVAIVLLLRVIAIVGVRVSSRVNLTMVVIKLAVILLFIVVGAFYVKTANWHPFIPPKAPPVQAAGEASTGTPLTQVLFHVRPLSYGIPGIIFGAAIVFFAFIGFDVVATAAEEPRNPQRDMPIGILGSLGVCTLLYVAVSLVMTGVVRYTKLNNAAPMATAFDQIGLGWASTLVTIGALAGLTTVMLVLLLGQSRVLFAMSRDHLLPPALAHVHPRFRTPVRIQLITGVMVALVAALVPIQTLAEMVNIGTLLAFILVSIGTVLLRRREPDLARSFRTPALPVVAGLAVLFCAVLMLDLAWQTWVRFVAWMLPGLVLYWLYGYRHSRLGQAGGRCAPAGGISRLCRGRPLTAIPAPPARMGAPTDRGHFPTHWPRGSRGSRVRALPSPYRARTVEPREPRALSTMACARVSVNARVHKTVDSRGDNRPAPVDAGAMVVDNSGAPWGRAWGRVNPTTFVTCRGQPRRLVEQEKLRRDSDAPAGRTESLA
jgi:APA family basic amino acid/polyamine antiporter